MGKIMPEQGAGYAAAGDGELFAQFRAGDERALETLLERYEKAIFHFLIGILRHRHQAEDVLQETWCRALEHLDGVDGEHFRGWLFTVAYHQAMHLKRKQKTRATLPLYVESLEDRRSRPEAVAIRGEQIQRLRELVECLPAAQREVIVQRVYEGKRFREIAGNLACPLNTALARMHEGLKKLKLLWGSENV